ncbi:SWI/SNF-related matrix-associated actin-dependent regulator of chromatin subfamily A [Dissostichus eleginoides]|uniref:DNA helicase n=1 Tax=Dissostichus eleginoides TaxID=100907 RepID=A0AAD9BYR9_DISEL|nr:SWI/SNF-related matrix-associated actin-dependent regulator of chromatin subfamily A [Dissostichus eleginoides]
MFNLDRFRYDKKTTKDNEEDSGSQSPESEKENKPAKMKPVKAQTKSNARGVVFEEVLTIDLEEDELISETKNKTLARKFKNPIGKSSKNVASDHADDEDCELKEKTDRLLEMFPQLTRTQVLEVIKNTNTLDGAAAECILRFGDKEAPDQGRKRKQDGSGSSQDSGEDQPSKKNRPLEVSDEEDEEDKGPSREKKQAMVRKLQKKFPDQDKEELRMVLQEHDWNVEDALQVLQMFSDPDESSFSSPDSEEKKSRKSKSKETSSKDHRKSRLHKDHRDSKSRKKSEDEISSESEEDNKGDPEGDAEVTQDSEDSDSDSSVDSRNKRSTSTLVKSPDLVSSSPSVKKFTTSAFLMPSSSTSTAQMLSRFASGTSIAKKQAAERKKKVLASDEHVSSEGENDDEEETVSSEFEDSDEELDCKGGMTDLKKEMLQFFQDATIDELSLISGCSVKKAKKILERRPFEGWQSLVDVFTKDKGLSENLLMGCRVVLKERKVVLGLMSKCQTISSKMVRQVTAVMERGTAAMKQPKLLNRNNQLKPYQLIGLKWMLLMYEHKLSGILADEMMGIEGPHLIIVPASTLDNWVREMKLWCPSLKVVVYCGSLEDRRYLRHELLDDKTEYNVIVTTYNMAIGNDNDRGVFRKLRLKYALFDEGHMLKNMNSLRYRHLMSINAEHRMLLTGTPLQNNLLELMSLLNFIMPSLFSSSTHQLSKMFSMKSHEEQSRFERDRISQAKLIMKPFILRRVKSEVLKQLPAKVEKVRVLPNE